MKNLFALPAAILALLPMIVHAQFNLDGQILQRAEYRNGFNRLINTNDDPAGFIAHRARLQAKYALNELTMYMSVQDIRTWGNTPQVKATDNFLSLHEAWAEYKFSEKWSARLGRQELNYDNARFLGNLDWFLQGRAHDFALVKYENGPKKLHLGGGYNQDEQRLSGSIFTVPNQYKIAQFARFENTTENWHYSLLFWNDGRQYVESAERKGVRYRTTLGMPALRYQKGKTVLNAFYYHQLGKDVLGRDINGYDFSAQITYQLHHNDSTGARLRLVGGTEWISGTDMGGPADKNNSYSPQYDTNHLFNGYMDLFYVAGAFENSVGLQDYFLKGRYDFSAKGFVQADAHLFFSNARVLSAANPQEEMDRYLGTEFDLTFGYVFTPAVSLQAGYSQLFFSDTFERVQNNGILKRNQNWAYVMLVFRPTMRQKFIGVLF